MSDDAVTAVVGALAYTNWTQYQVDVDFLTPTDAYTLTVANPTSAQVTAIGEGTPISLMLGTTVLLLGWVDEKRLQSGRAGDFLTLSGRDASAPLVDCHVPMRWTWKSTTLATVAALALTELGITMAVEASAEAQAILPWVHPEPGETFWDLLDREAKRARLMLWCTPGVLHIGRPTYTSGVVGQLRRQAGPMGANNNVKQVEIAWKTSSRRSPILVAGQCSGSDALYGAGASRVSGQATDADLVMLGLSRPAVLHDAGVRTAAQARARAKWEVSRRAGDAWSARYTVPGHRPSAGRVWGIDELVDVQDARAGVSGPKWVSAVRFTSSRQAGAETTLTLRELNSILPPV